eukprot:13044253-Alexandrium_andersonii.AAC.1
MIPRPARTRPFTVTRMARFAAGLRSGTRPRYARGATTTIGALLGAWARAAMVRNGGPLEPLAALRVD